MRASVPVSMDVTEVSLFQYVSPPEAKHVWVLVLEDFNYRSHNQFVRSVCLMTPADIWMLGFIVGTAVPSCAKN